MSISEIIGNLDFSQHSAKIRKRQSVKFPENLIYSSY